MRTNRIYVAERRFDPRAIFKKASVLMQYFLYCITFQGANDIQTIQCGMPVT